MTDDYELDAFDMGNSLIHKPRPAQMRTPKSLASFIMMQFCPLHHAHRQ